MTDNQDSLEAATTLAHGYLKSIDETLPIEVVHVADADAHRFFHPVRGGAAIIVGQDGTFLTAQSSVPPLRHEEMFIAGVRTDPELLKKSSLVEDLVMEAMVASADRDFPLFDEKVKQLCQLPWGEAVEATQKHFAEVLRAVFGKAPTYDQLIRVSKGVHMELVKAGLDDFSPYTVEIIIRSYYGDSEMAEGMPGEWAMMLDLAIAGVLMSGPQEDPREE